MVKRLLHAWLLLTMSVACQPVLTSTQILTDTDALNRTSGVEAAGYYSLPKAKVRLEAQREADTNPCTLSFKEYLYEPDPNYLFRLDYNPTWTGADKITVTVDASGFLKTILVDVEDKSGLIGMKIVKTGTEVAKSILTGGFKASAAGTAPTDAFLYNIIVDPDDSTLIRFINDNLKLRKCPTFEIKSKGASGQKPGPTPITKGLKENGLFYRPARPYDLIFSDPNGKPFSARTLFIPNNSPLFVLDVTRAALVKKLTTIQFENGVVTEVKLDKPSAGEALVDIPLGIARDIVSLPAQLIQLKVDLSTKDKSLVDAQKDAIVAQKALLEAQEELRKLRDQLEEPGQ